MEAVRIASLRPAASVEWSDSVEVYTFDEYRLDVAERRVWRGTSLVPMSPKTFDLLVVMVQGAGRLLQKEFLIQTLWPDSYVQDANLSVHISNLRKALGKNSESQQFIETIPRIGYRLVVPVSRIQALLNEEGSTALVGNNGPPALPVEPLLPPGPTSASTDTMPGLAHAAPRWRRWLFPIFICLLVGVAGAFSFSLLTARTRGEVHGPTSTRPLTGTPGQFLQPSFSPDGQQLAYTWRSGTDAHQSVYLQSIASEDRKLFADTGGDDYSPIWSPDGSEIAFLHAASDDQPLEVIVAKKDSPALRRRIAVICPANDIFRTSPTLSWAQNGQTLVTTDCPAGNGSPAVTTISTKDGDKRPLTHPASRTWDDQAVFSPDGSQIAFRRSRGDASDEIYVLPATGGQERELTFRSSPVDGLAWSRDGKRIIFSSGQATSLGSIWSLSLAGGDPVVITTPLTHTSSPTIAATGHRMAYVNSPKNVSVWRLSTGAHHEAEPFISSNFFDASAVYAPDGRHVAFRSDRSGTNEIWICQSDGSNPRRITHFNGPMTGSPRWSPDGRSVAFDSRVGGHADVYLVQAEGGEPVRITDSVRTNSDNVVPGWSHDGHAIYFSSNQTGNWQIWRHSLVTGENAQVTTHGGFNGMETADGHSLIYVADLERTEIRRLSLDGPPKDLPLAELGPGLWHAWTIAGNDLFYVKASSGSHSSPVPMPPALFRFDLKSNRTQSFGQVEQAVNDNLSASPDGRWILFARRPSSNTSIMILDGWD